LRRGAGAEEQAESMQADWTAGCEFLRQWRPNYVLEGNHDKRLYDLAENHTAGIKAVDIKKMTVNIEPNSLTVNWKVYIGPSGNGYTYEEFDSRGSAGGGEGAVDKQLSSMHSYHSGEPKLIYHFNKTIPVCYNSNGKKKTDGCKGTINIQQKFYKYGKKVK
jgi:hypothetical protein